MTKTHDYSHPGLAVALEEAQRLYASLVEMLGKIETLTGVPGYHATDDDDTTGVLERIQAIYDSGDELNRTELREWFISFDDDSFDDDEQ